ncbi:MAG: hypothetical protein WA667_18910 [Candidatus Nitrosopolaris sp.]
MDSFDETRASKQGTDIVGNVNENGTVCGSVTVSVKYTQTWSNEYMKQIADWSRFGVLVSRTFPKEALSDNAYLMRTRDGNSVILVKPEYAPLAYVGLRQATVVWFQATQFQEARDRQTDEMEKVFKALMYWINGEEFQESIRYIDCAVDEANKTKDLMNALNKHINNKISEALQCQDRIAGKLTKATALMRKLRELLNGGPDVHSLMPDGPVNSPVSNNLLPTLDDTRKKLITKLSIVKKCLNSKLGSSTILSILQDNPCRLRCKHLIRNITNPRVDAFYAAKHDYIRKELIDAIVIEFGDTVRVRSEDFASITLD